MGSDGARHLAEVLKGNQVIELQCNLQHLHALQCSQTLTTLHLGRNEIGANGARHLAEALKVNQVIELPRNGQHLHAHV